MTAQRTKEVGIRKVLGASAASIVYLFSKEFVILICVAFIISIPVSYLLMQSWLEDFAYHIQIGIGLFLITIAGSLVFALLTVIYKATKSAITNPVKSLKYE